MRSVETDCIQQRRFIQQRVGSFVQIISFSLCAQSFQQLAFLFYHLNSLQIAQEETIQIFTEHSAYMWHSTWGRRFLPIICVATFKITKYNQRIKPVNSWKDFSFAFVHICVYSQRLNRYFHCVAVYMASAHLWLLFPLSLYSQALFLTHSETGTFLIFNFQCVISPHYSKCILNMNSFLTAIHDCAILKMPNFLSFPSTPEKIHFVSGEKLLLKHGIQCCIENFTLTQTSLLVCQNVFWTLEDVVLPV